MVTTCFVYSPEVEGVDECLKKTVGLKISLQEQKETETLRPTSFLDRASLRYPSKSWLSTVVSPLEMLQRCHPHITKMARQMTAERM
jgi:hypothetical protein